VLTHQSGGAYQMGERGTSPKWGKETR
jgi:hypothetical protein